MKFEHAQNTLKYKVGDRVQVNADAGFSRYSKGVVVESPTPGFNWPLKRVFFVLRDGASEPCWFYPEELTLLQDPQSSNESGSLVQKSGVKNDVVSYAVNDNQPKAQDNSWYESGELPPVNIKCIFTGVDVDVEGVILAHVEYKGQYSAIIQCDGDWWHGEVGEFRPWYSDEEIAAQERKKIIDAISDVLIETERVSSYTDVAAHLYESGLRFVEQGE